MKKILLKSELLFILSPIIIVLSVIFNFHETKYLFSRSLIVVSIYCLIRFRCEVISDFYKKKKMLIGGGAFCLYFFLMQYLNEGNSDLPRSILYILIYFFSIPTRFLKENIIFYISSLGCLSSGILALYESYVLGMGRIGYLTINPIPYAFYSGLSLIVLIGTYKLLLNQKNRMIYLFFFMISLALGLFAIVHSQTRATYLALSVVGFSWIISFFILQPSKKNFSVSILLLVLVPSVFWNVSDVRVRTLDALHQIQNFSHNDYLSSTGARVILWKTGISISKDGLLLGQSKSDISKRTQGLIERNQVPNYIGQYLIHPNPNFHSQFVQTLVDSGLLGLIFLFLFLLSPLLVLKPYGDHQLKRLSLSVIGYTIICLLFDSMFLYNHTVILYALVSIMFYSISRKNSLESNFQ